MRRRTHRGFTLVELLVVISIIGVLVAMLLPAVESVRESARRAVCGNHLHQLALGCLSHETAQGFFPSGGWDWNWIGDPDRGFGLKQPGGWHYNILPYVDMQALHDMGKIGTYSDYLGRNVLTAADKMQAATPQAGMPVDLFNCPTRRKLIAFPEHYTADLINLNPNNPTMGRTDYAACAGPNYTGVGSGPGSLAAGDALTDCGNRSSTDWSQYAGTRWDYTSGVIYRHSVTKMGSIRHGTACTYLLGERNIDPDHYYDGTLTDDDQGWDQGYDFDTIRWTGENWYNVTTGKPNYDTNGNPLAGTSPAPSYLPPQRDTAGSDPCLPFGSAHADGFNMATCDGAVHKVSYNVSQDVHRRYGDCRDKNPVDLTAIP